MIVHRFVRICVSQPFTNVFPDKPRLPIFVLHNADRKIIKAESCNLVHFLVLLIELPAPKDRDGFIYGLERIGRRSFRRIDILGFHSEQVNRAAAADLLPVTGDLDGRSPPPSEVAQWFRRSSPPEWLKRSSCLPLLRFRGIDGQAATNSQKIAEVFEKQHKNVIQAIESLQVPDEWRELNFQPTSIEVQQPNGGMRQSKAYNITGDGFTGTEAMLYNVATPIKKFPFGTCKTTGGALFYRIDNPSRREAAMSKVPDHIVAAINTMLEPYGESYTPGASAPVGRGYLDIKDAWVYLGGKKSWFYSLVKKGLIRPIKTDKTAKNSRAIVSIAELEAFVQSCR